MTSSEFEPTTSGSQHSATMGVYKVNIIVFIHLFVMVRMFTCDRGSVTQLVFCLAKQAPSHTHTHTQKAIIGRGTLDEIIFVINDNDN
jgi:hypothetical protein